jgi:hypothetical protein
MAVALKTCSSLQIKQIMIRFFKKLFGGSSVNFRELVSNGAVIVDVRPVITVCRSGTRSGVAKGILKSAGVEIYNGGAWTSLKNKIA